MNCNVLGGKIGFSAQYASMHAGDTVQFHVMIPSITETVLEGIK